MIKFGVTIIQASDKKYAHNYIESDSLVGVARVISTFKPKRGYEVVQIMVEEAECLDLELGGYVKGTGILDMSREGIGDIGNK